MIHKCAHNGCGQDFPSERKLYVHYALMHDSFRDGTNMAEAIIKSLQKTQDRTLFLLLRFPECRIPHEEGYLFNKYIQYWCGTLVWDVAQQGFTSRDGKAIPYTQMAWTLKQLNSVSRARRLLQHREREKRDHQQPYTDILPPEHAEVMAATSERIHRGYYAGGAGL